MIVLPTLKPKTSMWKWIAYDLRKLRARGLIERPENPYVYALCDHGRKAPAMLVILRNRILRPIIGEPLTTEFDSDRMASS
jgi:hypothetical protein